MSEWVVAYTGPDTVKIGAVDYKILNMDADAARKEDCMGKCSVEEAEISVVFHRAPRIGAVTLLHEMMHAIWAEYDLDDREKEERAVTALSNGLSAAMRDNPAVFDWIRKALT